MKETWRIELSTDGVHFKPSASYPSTYEDEEEVALIVMNLNKKKKEYEDRKEKEVEDQPYIPVQSSGKPVVKKSTWKNNIPYAIRYAPVNPEKSIYEQRRNGEI